MDSNNNPGYYAQEAAGPTYTELAMANGLTPGKIAAAVDYVREQSPEDALDEYKRNAKIVAEALELVTHMAADLMMNAGELPDADEVIVVDLGPLSG